MLNTIARSTTKLLRRNYTMKIKIRNKTTAIAAASNYNKETDLEYFEFKETDLEYSKVPYSQRIIKARYRTEEEEGKYAAQALREGGEVPGTLYGGPRFQYGESDDTNKKVQTNDRRNVCVLNIVDLARDLRSLSDPLKSLIITAVFPPLCLSMQTFKFCSSGLRVLILCSSYSYS